MKTLSFSFLFVILLGLSNTFAQESGSLPFPVTVGGQAATYKSGEPFARLAKPVKADAAIEVGVKADMIVINVTKTNEKGDPSGEGQPATILLKATNKGTLAGTMDQQKILPGTYLMSVVANTQTASIIFTIE